MAEVAEVEPSPCPVVSAAKSTMSQIPSHVILSWFQWGDVGKTIYVGALSSMQCMCLRFQSSSAPEQEKILVLVSICELGQDLRVLSF